MTLSTAYEIFENPDFKNRVLVALTELINSGETPESWYYTNGLKTAATKKIVEAWEYSVAQQPYHCRRGYDPTVITDNMILAAVKDLSQTVEQ